MKPWNTKGVDGVFRFLRRSWRMITESEITDEPMTKAQLRVLHATIKKVTEDTNTMNFNTAISQMMIFLNEFSKSQKMPREAAEAYVLLLCPYAPHIAEEMWEILGKPAPASLAQWPSYDEAMLKEDEVEILIQVLGKPKARIMMSVNATPAEMEQIALADENVKKAIDGKTVVKVIAVPKRVVNIVVK